MLLLYLSQFRHRLLQILHLHSTMLLLYLKCPSCGLHIGRNLHSTMLLLYRIAEPQVHRFKLIYIPLCFYFIGWNHSGFYVCCSIYIPLCFYFINPTANPLDSEFGNLHSTMLLLYPQRMMACGLLQHHLHSTMLLLYRYTALPPAACSNIYIPLCFYFINGIRLRIQSPVLFTFHYASTLSVQSHHRQSCIHNLHSTMLLLYPESLYA